MRQLETAGSTAADRTSPPSHPFLRLTGYGCLSIVAYIAMAWFFIRYPWQYTTERVLNNLFLAAVLPLLFLAYWRGFQIIKHNPSSKMTRLFILFGALSTLAAMAIPNFHSTDITNYVNIGWQQAQYHLNPYVTLPMETPNFGVDKMITSIYCYAPCGYGFVYAHLCRILCSLGHGDLIRTLILFKIMNFCVFGALSAVVYFGARQLQLKRPDLSLYLCLWSPLLLLHSISNGHNDIVMILFVMLSLFAAACKRFWLAAPLLVCAILVKYIWFVAAPFLLIYTWQKGGAKAVAISILTASAAFAALSWAYIWQLHQFRLGVALGILGDPTGSLVAAWYHTGQAINAGLLHHSQWFMKPWMACSSAYQVVLLAGLAVFALRSLVISLKDSNYLTVQRLGQIGMSIIFVYVCLISSKFHPWYLVMFFPIAFWLPEGGAWRKVILVMSCIPLLAFTALGHARIINGLVILGLPMIWAFIQLRKSEAEPLSQQAQERQLEPVAV